MEITPKICFVFPPFCESAFHGPHLAIPLLRAVLEAQGVETRSFDLNIKTVHEVISPKFLECVADSIEGAGVQPEEQAKVLQAISHFTTTSLKQFTNSGSVQLKTLLKYAKHTIFPHPVDLEECLNSEFERPELCSNLYDRYVEDVLSEGPDVVCFSVAFSDQLSEAIELARRIRNKAQDVEVWLGGSQINLLQIDQIEACASSGHFHRISTGNGEQTVLSMVDEFPRLMDTCKVYDSQAMHPGEINEIPSPLFEPLSGFFSPISLPVLVTKGCYWGRCTFCDFPKLSNLGKRAYIARAPELALREIQSIQKRFGDVKINLISDAVPPSWYKKLCKAAIETGTRLNTWSYMMHNEALDDSFFSLMSRAGVQAINFGTESMVDRILSVMKKQSGYETIKKNLISANRHGVRVVTNVIPDYPTTTREEAFLNIERFQEMAPYISSVNPQMFDLTSGTPIADDPLEYGLEVPNSAYIKTSHGFHSKPFERDDRLTASDRRIIERTFARIKWRVQIDARKSTMPRPFLNEHEFLLDGSAILSSGTRPTLWLMSLGTSWDLSLPESRALGRMLKSPEGTITYQRIVEIASFELGSRNQAIMWVEGLMNSGLFVGLTNGNSDFKNMEVIYG